MREKRHKNVFFLLPFLLLLFLFLAPPPLPPDFAFSKLTYTTHPTDNMAPFPGSIPRPRPTFCCLQFTRGKSLGTRWLTTNKQTNKQTNKKKQTSNATSNDGYKMSSRKKCRKQFILEAYLFSSWNPVCKKIDLSPLLITISLPDLQALVACNSNAQKY